MKTLKILSTYILMAMLVGCSYLQIHKRDIEQGNVFSQEMVNRLHPGMTKGEVANIMGSPVLINTFADDRIDYVYTFKPGNGEGTEKLVTLSFQHGILKHIDGNRYSLFMK